MIIREGFEGDFFWPLNLIFVLYQKFHLANLNTRSWFTQPFYRTPFVLGKLSNSFKSRFTAIFIDLAKALKMASILWCSFCPSHLMFRLHLEVSENDLKKW